MHSPINHIVWLQCLIQKGMFSDERAITYPPKGDTRKSVFVPATFVDGEVGSTGKVRVELIQAGEKVLAILPTSDRDTVEAKEEDILETA